MAEDTFVVAEHNIEQVKDYVGANPDQLESVLEAEKARGEDARKTLVGWLEEQVAAVPKPSETSAVEVSPGAIVNAEVETVRIGGATYTVDPNKGYRYVAGAPAKG